MQINLAYANKIYWLTELKGVYLPPGDSLIWAQLDQKEQFDSPLHRLAFLVSVFASS